jgi:hypothetical protein
MAKIKLSRKEWKSLTRLSGTIHTVAGNAHDMADVATLLTRIRNDFDLMDADSDYPFLAGFAADTVANSLDRMTTTLVKATGEFHSLMHEIEEETAALCLDGERKCLSYMARKPRRNGNG